MERGLEQFNICACDVHLPPSRPTSTFLAGPLFLTKCPISFLHLCPRTDHGCNPASQRPPLARYPLSVQISCLLLGAHVLYCLELANVSRGATRGNQGAKGSLGDNDPSGRAVLQLRVQPNVLAVTLNQQSTQAYRLLDTEVQRALKQTKTYWRKARRRQDYDPRADQAHMELHGAFRIRLCFCLQLIVVVRRVVTAGDALPLFRRAFLTLLVL